MERSAPRLNKTSPLPVLVPGLGDKFSPSPSPIGDFIPVGFSIPDKSPTNISLAAIKQEKYNMNCTFLRCKFNTNKQQINSLNSPAPLQINKVHLQLANKHHKLIVQLVHKSPVTSQASQPESQFSRTTVH
jgi:hypothetical protein